MTTYIALLRGINVGKAKRIAMADLRALLEDLRSHKGSRAPLKLNLLVTIWLLEHILQVKTFTFLQLFRKLLGLILVNLALDFFDQ